MSLPKQIGHFEVLSELGRGGMGIVYEVRNTRNGAIAALKMIPTEALARADSELRFKREFRAMQRVEHPNVIRVFDAGTHEGCPYFTMELVDGAEIRKFIDGDEAIVPSGKDGPPNTLTKEQLQKLNEPARVKLVADLVVQVAFALAEIHSHRIVHRDLKPDNILISRAGVAKLMDFGIAKQLNNNSEHSTGGMVVGTFKYLSPEQALGGEIDGRADLYCLGVILYELLSGRHPFYSENSVGYAYHHAKKPPPDLEKFNPDVHKGLKSICERLVKKDPRERFATAEDVIAAIREAVDGQRPAETQSLKRGGPPPVKNLPFELAKDQLFAPAHVGRDGDVRLITTTFERLLTARGGIVLVSGGPGIGKTRLLKEAGAAAKSKSIELLWGRCVAQGGPYHPYVEALEGVIADVAHKPPEELKRLLGEEGRVLARYVPGIERLDPAARPRPAKALEPQGERLRFLSAVTAFLGRISAKKPRVVVIDDLHFADELTLSLTRHLVDTLAKVDTDASMQRGAPIAVAVTWDPAHPRATDVSTLIAKLQNPGWADAGVASVQLKPLPAGDVREMLASMIGGEEVAVALAEYLEQETGGIPGAVEERVRAWVESGELRRASSSKGRQWVFVKSRKPASGDVDEADRSSRNRAAEGVVEVREATRWDIPIPDLKENANEKRVARLSPIARDVAERMAVVGERVSGVLVERIALRPEDELIDALDELVKRALLAEDDDDGAYHFPDAEDRRALLHGLSPARKEQLHLLAARAVDENAKRQRRQASPEELANHYVEGNEPVMAIEQLMIAARTALAASATQTAAQRVREAQELLAAEQKSAEQRNGPNDPRLARADVELVLLRLDVLAAVNEHKECVTLAKRRLPRMQGVVDGALVAEVLLRLAASERVLGELDAALEHTGQVLTRTERGGSHALRCRAKSLCGQIYEQRGSFDLAERYFQDALELSRTIGDELEEERARWAIAQRHLVTGALFDAHREFEQLLQLATARGEKLRVIQYVNALGIIAHERNEMSDAEVAYRRMIELAKPAGDRRSLAQALTNIAIVRRDVGDFDEALVLTGKAARILSDLDQVENLSYLRIVESQILLDRAAHKNNKADNAEALKRADEGLDLALRANAALKVAEAALCRGLALLRRGDSAGREDLQRGGRVARQVNANRIALFALLCEVEAAAQGGEKTRARDALREGRERARNTGFARFDVKLAALAARLGL